jgi:LysM repeat protein
MRRLLLFFCIILMLVPTLTVAAQTDAQAEAQFAQVIHIVQPGETLNSIAQLYGTTAQAIAAANGIFNANFIYVGQRLIIPTGGYPPTQSYYIVQRGDTLARIARRFGTTVWAIAQANNIFNINRIYVGQYLVIPGGTYPPTDPTVISYYVRYGDTLARIAAAYGTTWQAIAAYNGIVNPNRIYAGQLIYIPVW